MIRKKFLIYTVCSLVMIFSNIYTNNSQVLAATENTNYSQNTNITVNQSENTYNSDISTVSNNIYASAGITQRDAANKYMNVTTTNGDALSSNYINSNNGKSTTDYAKITYKSDSTSQKMQTAFGDNTTQLNTFLGKYGNKSDTEVNSALDRLSAIQKQAADILNSANSSYATQGTNLAFITNGTEFAAIVQQALSGNTSNLTPEQIQTLADLAQEYSNYTGDRNILPKTLQDIELAIEKAGQDGKDAVVTIKPNTRTFRYITKVRYTVTDKDTGEAVGLAVPDNSKTQQLFTQYNATYDAKWKQATGGSIPALQTVGNGIYEMDFETPIKATDNPWKKILADDGWQVTGADPYAGDFAAVAAFNMEKSSRTLQVKIDVIGNTCSCIEKITDATYPIGKTDVAGTYTFNKYDQSFETGWYIDGFKTRNGDLEESYGVVPNRVMEREEYENDDNDTRYRTITHNNMPFHSNKYNFEGSENSSKGSDVYKTWNQGDSTYFAKGVGYGLQIMDSTYDGKNCRDIKFKIAKVRHWDYRDDIVTGSEAYSSNGASGTSGDGDIGAAVMQRYKLSDAANIDLVTFDRSDTGKVESNVVNGYCKVKETPVWRAPDQVREGIFNTVTWTLSPLEGSWQIPVLGPTGDSGNMRGAINGANNEIGANKNITDITNNSKLPTGP